MTDDNKGCFAMMMMILGVVASIITAGGFLIAGASLLTAMGVLLVGWGASVVVFFLMIFIFVIFG